MPRLRVFAGPNGSGKSTIKADLDPRLVKTYLNADELEKDAKRSGFIDLSAFGVHTTLLELLSFHAHHFLITSKGLDGNRVDYRNVDMNSYFASVITDFLRQRLLENGTSFTFETVMSHPSKVQFIREAQSKGYRVEDIPDWFFEAYVDRVSL